MYAALMLFMPIYAMLICTSICLLTVIAFSGSTICPDCPPGYRCTRRIQADPCPQGRYCPGKTGYDTHPCPNGTYGARQYLKFESECTKCTGGSFCGETGLDRVSGQCKPGRLIFSGIKVDFGII